MRAKDPTRAELQLRLELLCLRATVERQSLAIHSQQLRLKLSPQHWVESATHMKGGELLTKGFSLAVQYPYLTSALTSMLLKKRWRALKWTGLAMLIWQTIHMSRERKP